LFFRNPLYALYITLIVYILISLYDGCPQIWSIGTGNYFGALYFIGFPLAVLAFPYWFGDRNGIRPVKILHQQPQSFFERPSGERPNLERYLENRKIKEKVIVVVVI